MDPGGWPVQRADVIRNNPREGDALFAVDYNGILVSDAYMDEPEIQNNKYRPIQILTISCLVIFLLFIWQGNKGFNLWDEGYLWYGVQRVLLGEIPIRDFMSYDPGRYYWVAALLSVAGDNGIMSVRIAVAVFQCLGLFVGLLLIAQSTKSRDKADILFWIISAAILVLWMFPRHKLFDISISIFLIGILTYLVSNPIPKRYLIAGICVGLIAVFGRNHGVYGVVGSLGVIAWLNIRNRSDTGFLKGFVLWSVGVTIGFLPIIFMALLIPGFAVAFWESVRFLFEQKATNLPLPVPWPWTINFAASSIGDAARGVLIGIFFIGTLIFGGLSVIWVVYRGLKEKPLPPVLVASAFLALPYAHYAFSRADVGHLAQGIFPLLIGILAIASSASSKTKWVLAAGLFMTSFWVMHVFHPGWQCLASKQCVTVEISGKDLQVDSGTANDIALLRQLAAQFTPDGQPFIATPFWPGAYALFNTKSPMYGNYLTFPRDGKYQRKEIYRIENSKPKFILVLDIALDGREDLRFKNSQPYIFDFIVNNYSQMKIEDVPANYLVFKEVE